MSDFHVLPIIDVRRETADAISVAFAIPVELRAAFAFKPGQHVNVRAEIDGEPVQRTYSICSQPSDRGFRIAIKRLPGGRFSTWAHASLQSGMRLAVEPPSGRFVLGAAEAAPRSILAIAAGIGITPVIGVVRQALDEDAQSRVTLIYGNRRLEDAVFAEELEALKDRFVERMSLVHVLSRGEDTDSPLLEGRIDGEKLRTLARHTFVPARLTATYLCGPGSLIKDLRATLLELEVARERVHYEFFAAGGGAYRSPASAPVTQSSAAAATVETGAELVLTLDGARHRIRARPGEAVIDAALRAGLRAPYACKGGMCCTCRARIVEGTAEMRHNYSLEPWEIAQGFVLTCQAVATSGRLVVDYDQM